VDSETVDGAVDEDEGEGRGEGGEEIETVGVVSGADEGDEKFAEEDVEREAGRVGNAEERDDELEFARVGGEEAGGESEGVEGEEGEKEEERIPMGRHT
jgi:hypothetical protein